jgi:hypothetical protein
MGWLQTSESSKRLLSSAAAESCQEQPSQTVSNYPTWENVKSNFLATSSSSRGSGVVNTPRAPANSGPRSRPGSHGERRTEADPAGDTFGLVTGP